jgi:hypothetical protein
VATILNLSYVAKDMGLNYTNGHDETKWACFMLCVALLLFTVASYREKNAAYGSVFIWTVYWIKKRQLAYENI